MKSGVADPCYFRYHWDPRLRRMQRDNSNENERDLRVDESSRAPSV